MYVPVRTAGASVTLPKPPLAKVDVESGTALIEMEMPFGLPPAGKVTRPETLLFLLNEGRFKTTTPGPTYIDAVEGETPGSVAETVYVPAATAKRNKVWAIKALTDESHWPPSSKVVVPAATCSGADSVRGEAEEVEDCTCREPHRSAGWVEMPAVNEGATSSTEARLISTSSPPAALSVPEEFERAV